MAKQYQHLSLGERSLIQTQLLQGFTPSAIAKNLSRSRSCISRKLARNVKKLALHPRPVGRPPLTSSYCSVRANDRAHVLAVKPRVPRKRVVGNALWVKVRQGLESGLSPEQVAGLLWCMDEPISLSHETIYQAIYVMPKGELRTEMIALLRQGHHKRRPRARGVDRRGQIPNMTSIDLRPADIQERLVPGHWEGDHIKGSSNRSQVGTLAERKTRYVALVHLKDGTATTTTKGFGTILQRFAANWRKSLTYDQGKEMSGHEQLAQDAQITVYFAHPHSPWERGSNENTHGLLRQYLRIYPKGLIYLVTRKRIWMRLLGNSIPDLENP